MILIRLRMITEEMPEKYNGLKRYLDKEINAWWLIESRGWERTKGQIQIPCTSVELFAEITNTKGGTSWDGRGHYLKFSLMIWPGKGVK